MSLSDRGWQVFPAEPATIDWARSVSTEVSDALKTTERRHGATWAPGVDLLKNDASGAVAGGVALVGEALVAAQSLFGPLPLHAAQISAVWPGYPKQDPEESDANHRYRRARDAAHIDGLLPEGPNRRRHLREPHAWILGIGLTDTPAAPLVAWKGSAPVFRKAFASAFEGVPPESWGDVDVTDLYQSTRRKVFETCARVEIPLQTGEGVLLDRHVLHGVAPWTGHDTGPRVTAFFRPELPTTAEWL